MTNSKILVATHKTYWMPDDPLYLPIQVGAALHADLGFATRDDTGEHISDKNGQYCELTALYWAWKNLQADTIGLAHYRRHFAAPGARGPKRGRVLTGAQLQAAMRDTEALLPSPRHYHIETNWSQYAHAHYEADLQATRDILGEVSPTVLPAFDAVMRRTWGHRFNMLILSRPLFDAYCSWLFDVLAHLEGRLDTSAYSAYDARVYGFVAERLLDVWLQAEDIRYGELPYVFLESQNWMKKTGNFLLRKARGGKKT